MSTPRDIPDRLLLAASGKTTRIIAHRAAGWVYKFDAIPELVPEFWIPHGTWRRGPYDHQRRGIDDLEIVEINGVLVTSVRQTLADLCGVLDLDMVERALESALRMGAVDELALRDFAYLFTFSREGAPGLREVLERRPHGAPPTGSDLETLCLQVFRRGGIPDPQRQFPVRYPDGGFVADADFGWWWVRFVVETDGLETHKTREQQQYDTNRQNRITDAGYAFRRFTYTDVTRRPNYVCRETRLGLLAAPSVNLSNRRKGALRTVPNRSMAQDWRGSGAEG
jgi:hypothetical protein